jgi:ribosome recycling factor
MSYNFTNFDTKIEAATDWLAGEFRAVQTGRATPMVLDNINVEAYGSWMNISHVAAISIEDAKTLRVSPYDKSVIRDVEKAVNEADLGLSVSSDSDGLRINFPMLTTERRVQYVKIIKDRLEEGRIRVRAAREEAKREIEDGAKAGEYGEDEKKRYMDSLQAKVDTANNMLESQFANKEKEVMGIE